MKKSAAILAGLSMLLFSQNGIAGKVTGYQIVDPHISLFAIRKGDITRLKQGTNNVGEPIVFTCTSAAGCLLTTEFFGGISGNVDSLSVLLDGALMSPTIRVTPAQSAPVAAGSHTIQIQAAVPSEGRKGELENWEFRFAAYELGN